jgi:soluble lytic murein transglycosylase
MSFYASFPLFLFILFWTIFSSTPVYAVLKTPYQQEKQLFLSAEMLIKNKKITTEEQLKSRYPTLKTHILYPYLAAPLSHNNPLPFIKRYPDYPQNSLLLERWAEEQFQHKNWSALLHPLPTQTPSLLCIQMHARIESQSTLINKDFISLWKKNALHPPPACARLFKRAFQKKRLSDHDVIAYMQDTALHRPYQLYSTMKTLFPFLSETQAIYRLLLPSTQSHPQKVIKSAPHLPKHPLRTMLLIVAFQQFLKKDSNLALDSWRLLQKEHKIDNHTLFLCAKECALFLAKNQKIDALQWLKRIPKEHMDPLLQEWRLRLSLKAQQWPQVISYIHQLPENLYSNPRWQYWLARAYAQTGDENLSQALYQKLSTQRHYYGFLSSEHMHRSHSIQTPQHTPSPTLLKNISQTLWFQRFHALLHLSKDKEARRELEYILPQLSGPELYAAMDLLAPVLTQKGHPHWMIQCLMQNHHAQSLKIRFPMLHLNIIQKNALKHGLNPAWILAIIRQESAFKADARSPAGALGMMQLMPRTAKEIAHHIKHPLPHHNALLHPESNIALGSAYLKKLKTRFQHPVLATAAYNAGPYRVSQWLPSKPLPVDIWIETIPFGETRDYVVQVMAFYSIYNYLMGRSTHFHKSEWMHPVNTSLSHQ